MDWENHLEKIPIQKIKKKIVKTRLKLPHVNKKTTSEKTNFCLSAVFSLYFKDRAKKIHAAKTLAFSLHFLFRRDQNHHSNLTSKIMEMCEQVLKKTAPQYKSNTFNCTNSLWIVKNHDVPKNSRYRFHYWNESASFTNNTKLFNGQKKPNFFQAKP